MRLVSRGVPKSSLLSEWGIRVSYSFEVFGGADGAVSKSASSGARAAGFGWGPASR